MSPSPPAPPQQNTAAILRPLYARAVRAFLHRDIVLTYSLLTSAFALITPPSTSAPDSLSDHRRKWDILRITLDVTVYTAPPADSATIPAALRSNALLSAAALLASLHSRSVRLFAPRDRPTPNHACLPAQVLVTLALASARIGCPAAGRGIIEDWLACRTPATTPATSKGGYEKVLEVYLLNILPTLGEWTYATQFLGYENELPVQSRERLVESLACLHEQHLASFTPEPPPPPPPAAPSSSHSTHNTLPTPLSRSLSTSSPLTESSSLSLTPTPSRPSSPTPSNSSASTTSTHTAVPANPHPRASRSKPGHDRINGHAHPLTPLTPTPSSSTATLATHGAAPRAPSRSHQRSPARERNETSTSAERRAASWHSFPRAVETMPGYRSSSSSLLGSIYAAIRPYIRYAPLFLLCVVLPAFAVFLRLLRRRRTKSLLPSSPAAAAAAAMVAGAGLGVGSAARTGAGVNFSVDAARTRMVEDVRRRLSGVQGRRGLLSAIWDEAVRAIWDTVAMGGRGLV